MGGVEGGVGSYPLYDKRGQMLLSGDHHLSLDATEVCSVLICPAPLYFNEGPQGLFRGSWLSNRRSILMCFYGSSASLCEDVFVVCVFLAAERWCI